MQAVEDPRTMGQIREEGGKMYMSLGQWETAYNEFYEGFRNYQEAGNERAKVRIPGFGCDTRFTAVTCMCETSASFCTFAVGS
jgi:hypothetical protein